MGNNTTDKLNYAPEKKLKFWFSYYHGKDSNGNPIPDPTIESLNQQQASPRLLFNYQRMSQP